jgi:hypothetical protein
MSGVSFSKANLCSGIETVSTSQVSPRSITFEKKMEGTPSITLTPIESNQSVIAVNVTSAGFDIILSLDGTGDPNATFKVHYQAIFLR